MDKGHCNGSRCRKDIFITLVLVSTCFVFFTILDTEKTRTFFLRTTEYDKVKYIGDVMRYKLKEMTTASVMGLSNDKAISETKKIDIRNENPPGVITDESIGVTSDKTSTFYIVNSSKIFSICDQLDVIIEAKDDKNQSKENGGDYFRVRIFNLDLKAGASPDGEVIYIGGGRYKASFTLRWVGLTFVRVILVHPAEAVNVLRRARETFPTRYGYLGRFERRTGNKTVREDTFCNVIPPNRNVTTCDLTRLAIEAPWYCTAPSVNGLNCTHFAWTCASTKYAEPIINAAMTPEERNLFVRQKQPIKVQGNNFVTVSQQESDISSPAHCHNETLPPCSVGIHNLSSPRSAGYFLNAVWYSNYCRLRQFRAEDVLKCLTNKTLFFHGDSTTRQYYEYLVRMLKNTLKPNPPTKQSNWKVGPSLAEDKVHNFTVRYRHHGYPVRNNWTDARELLYIEEALDKIMMAPDTVFVFTIWAHLTTKNMSFYEHRVRRIRAAVERLHQRSPDTLVVIKSANTRSHSGAVGAITLSDWYARELDKKMREIFQDYDKIGFIDQWSMVVGWSNVDAVHPGEGVISSGIRTLLSYICPL